MSKSVLAGLKRRTRRKGESKYTRPPLNQARVYADVCLKRPLTYSDYPNFVPQWRGQGDYEVLKKIGRGKYSEVFFGMNTETTAECVIKILKPVRLEKINREISILQALCGGTNIIQLLDLVRDPTSLTPSLIFEKVNAVDHKTLYPTLSDLDVRYYIFELLKALEYAHSNGIMHRDVKPHNVMIDPRKRKLRLIDWGLAEYYIPGREYHVRVASRPYKGPELLTGMRDYDYSLDMWSTGCMLAGMIFHIPTFFPGRDNYDQLVKITQVMGTEDLLHYITKYDLVLDHQYQGMLKNFPRQPWSRFVTSANRHLAHEDAIDFLDHLLVYDHQKRFTAQEAMAHRYFDPVRDQSPKGSSGLDVNESKEKEKE